MNRIKALFIIFFIPLFFVNQTEPSAEMSHEELNETVLDETSLDDVQIYWNDLATDYSAYVPDLDKVSLYEFIKDNGRLSVSNTVSGIIKYLFYELILNGKLLGLLLVLTIFSTLLQTMHHAFEESSISKIAYFVVYIVLIYLALNSFFLAYSYAENAIAVMGSFMIALIPLILGLLATFGNIMTVSFFHPIIILLINMSSVLISKFVLPLVFLSALLLVVSSLSDNYQVTHLANLLRKMALFILGAFLTIFLGVMSVQGTASAIKDGVAMKATKFITGNFIPVIGRTFTEATDTILSASLLLKNAVGIVGVVMVLFIALFPALKIFAIALTFKIAAAVLQPIGDGPVIASLNIISKSIIYVLACLLAVTFMFFFSIVIIIIATNVTLLLR